MNVVKGFIKGVCFVIKIILSIIGVGMFVIALGDAFDIALDDNGEWTNKSFGQLYDELYNRWNRGYEKLEKKRFS